MEGITDSMRQYGRSTEEIIKRKPKNGREYGIKRPESINIVAVLAGLFALSVIIVELMQ